MSPPIVGEEAKNFVVVQPKGIKIPYHQEGQKFKFSIKTGEVRVTRWMLVTLMHEMMQYLPRDKFDLSVVDEILADYDKDVVLEVGLPPNRKGMVTDIKSQDDKVPPEGGLWITVHLKETKTEG